MFRPLYIYKVFEAHEIPKTHIEEDKYLCIIVLSMGFWNYMSLKMTYIQVETYRTNNLCLNLVVFRLIHVFVLYFHMFLNWALIEVFVELNDTVRINLLNPTGHVMHQQFNIQQLYALPTLYLCVLYLSENKQRLVPLTA